jgi:acetyl-CoA C-acetyltransferase
MLAFLLVVKDGEGLPSAVESISGDLIESLMKALTKLLCDADVPSPAGPRVLSRSPYSSPAMRFGARMSDTKMVDMMVAALSDPFDDCHMGMTAENVAKM